MMHLDISNNPRVGSRGTAEIATALTSSACHLRGLNLAGAGVRNSGAKSLGTALLNNATLRHLDLYGNSIGDRGAAYVAEALWFNRTLRTLNLGWNRLNTPAKNILATSLEANGRMTHLYVSTTSSFADQRGSVDLIYPVVRAEIRRVEDDEISKLDSPQLKELMSEKESHLTGKKASKIGWPRSASKEKRWGWRTSYPHTEKLPRCSAPVTLDETSGGSARATPEKTIGQAAVSYAIPEKNGGCPVNATPKKMLTHGVLVANWTDGPSLVEKPRPRRKRSLSLRRQKRSASATPSNEERQEEKHPLDSSDSDSSDPLVHTHKSFLSGKGVDVFKVMDRTLIKAGGQDRTSTQVVEKSWTKSILSAPVPAKVISGILRRERTPIQSERASQKLTFGRPAQRKQHQRNEYVSSSEESSSDDVDDRVLPDEPVMTVRREPVGMSGSLLDDIDSHEGEDDTNDTWWDNDEEKDPFGSFEVVEWDADDVVGEDTESSSDDSENNSNNDDSRRGALSGEGLGDEGIVSHKGTEEDFGTPKKSNRVTTTTIMLDLDSSEDSDSDMSYTDEDLQYAPQVKGAVTTQLLPSVLSEPPGCAVGSQDLVAARSDPPPLLHYLPVSAEAGEGHAFSAGNRHHAAGAPCGSGIDSLDATTPQWQPRLYHQQHPQTPGDMLSPHNQIFNVRTVNREIDISTITGGSAGWGIAMCPSSQSAMSEETFDNGTITSATISMPLGESALSLPMQREEFGRDSSKAETQTRNGNETGTKNRPLSVLVPRSKPIDGALKEGVLPPEILKGQINSARKTSGMEKPEAVGSGGGDRGFLVWQEVGTEWNEDTNETEDVGTPRQSNITLLLRTKTPVSGSLITKAEANPPIKTALPFKSPTKGKYVLKPSVETSEPSIHLTVPTSSLYEDINKDESLGSVWAADILLQRQRAKVMPMITPLVNVRSGNIVPTQQSGFADDTTSAVLRWLENGMSCNSISEDKEPKETVPKVPAQKVLGARRRLDCESPHISIVGSNAKVDAQVKAEDNVEMLIDMINTTTLVGAQKFHTKQLTVPMVGYGKEESDSMPDVSVMDDATTSLSYSDSLSYDSFQL